MIGATISATSTGLSVTPPTWRPDLTDAPTLAEEVARIVGYDRIPSVLPVAPPGRGYTREQQLRRSAAQSLAFAGLTEVLSYPFVDEAAYTLAGATQAVRLANPLDPAAPFMRTALLPGLIETAHRNLSRGLTDLALFEIGHVFLPDGAYGSGPVPASGEYPGEAKLAELNASIPAQPWHVAALFLGEAIARQPGSPAVAAGIADALAAVQQLAATLAVEIRVVAGSHAALHPGRTAEIFAGDRSLGHAGELLPALAEQSNLPRVVGYVELDLDALIELGAREVLTAPIASFPAATQDLTLIVAADIPAGAVRSAVIDGAGALLEDAALVDDYRGTGVPEGSKSLTFALRFRASDRTLTAAEASEAKAAAVALATTRHGATTRE
jgi:phenylalanyl-tRNA synthetase beta chain